MSRRVSADDFGGKFDSAQFRFRFRFPPPQELEHVDHGSQLDQTPNLPSKKMFQIFIFGFWTPLAVLNDISVRSTRAGFWHLMSLYLCKLAQWGYKVLKVCPIKQWSMAYNLEGKVRSWDCIRCMDSCKFRWPRHRPVVSWKISVVNNCTEVIIAQVII